MTCPDCPPSGRYCAPARCYCGHPACYAYATYEARTTPATAPLR